MRISRALLAMGLTALTILSCSDDGTAPSATSFAGTWTATRFEYVNAANPAIEIEVIGLGGSLVVELREDRTYSYTATFPGEAPETGAGTWSNSVDTFTLSGNTLTLTGADSEFDFDGDDMEEDATLNLTLVR